MARIQTKTGSLTKQFSKVDDYVMLIKLRLSLLVVITSVLTYILAAGSMFSWTGLVMLALGGFFVTAAANALNQVLEKDFDCMMSRTENRPVTAGRMTSSEAILFSGITLAIGITILSTFNPLTSFLAMLSFVLYTFVYTPLKRHSPLAVAVGGIPGALPALIGCVAIENQITYLGLGIFIIQFLWQFPHFWSIGYLGFDDYSKAGYKLVPTEGKEISRSIGLTSSIYTLLIVPVIMMLFYQWEISLIAMILSVGLTLIYAMFGINFHKKFDRPSALKLMFSSFFYLPLILITYLVF